MREYILPILDQLENEITASKKIERWNEKEMLTCLNEIRISIQRGHNPKYAVRLLMTYAGQLQNVPQSVQHIYSNLRQYLG